MKIQDLGLSVALTGFHELSVNGTTVYCDGKNYIPEGLPNMEADEVYLFKEINEEKLENTTQYFVAFAQLGQQVALKFQQYNFTVSGIVPGKILLQNGTAENAITRINNSAFGV